MPKKNILLIGGVALVLLLIVGLIIWLVTSQKKKSTTPSPTTTAPPTYPPRWDNIEDCGYGGTNTRGWFDINNIGAYNDYCRWVGNAPGTQGGWFSCAMAGSTEQYTPESLVISDTLPHENLQPGDQCYTDS